jgi:putative redox protein
MTTREPADNAASSEGTVTVTETGTGTYTQQITAGRHQLAADEPQPIGADSGPTPYDLLLPALGACTSTRCECTPTAMAGRSSMCE